ncbi:MAG: alanine--tRNA ligase, partial [Candidatus Kapaibacteriota bacterium]
TNSNYDTDLFLPLISKLEELSGKKYPSEVSHPDGIAMRVVSDHIRTLSFAIADGAIPSNEGRGYVLRRILRRASRFARRLGFDEPIIYKLVPTLIEIMGDFFTELKLHQNVIERIIRAEEENFIQTLDRGIEKFDDIVQKQKSIGSNVIPGEVAFLLYDSFGFPLDLTQLMAREIGFTIDIDGFNKKMEEQRSRSRQSSKFQNIEIITAEKDLKTTFTGYNEFETFSKVIHFEDNKLITSHTPFYVESGGQVSDIGTITAKEIVYNVVDMSKVGDIILHHLDKPYLGKDGDEVFLRVDIKRRRNIMRNHSATHLLHESLVRVLGGHVRQAGSLVAPDYLRFDFNHFERLTDKQVSEIENLVNEKIFEALEVRTDIMSLDEARTKTKAKMFFGEKYGEIVRVVSMGDFSSELCGGTHVRNTNEIGAFKIISEQSIAAGIRRIEAVSGIGVLHYLYLLKDELNKLRSINASLEENFKNLRKELQTYEKTKLRNLANEWVASARIFNNVRVLVKEIEFETMDSLRDTAETIRNAFGNRGIAFIFAPSEDKLYIACSVTDDLVVDYPAGSLVNIVAQKFGGRGGGKPHLATAGAKINSDYRKLLSNFNDIINLILT